jgi:signal peptidase
MTAARRSGLAVLVGLTCVLLISGGIFWVKGYRMYVIHTGSMQPTLKLGTLVVTQPAGRGYGPGDVITFRHSDTTTDLVTHRVFAIDSTGITTKGDANATPDAWTIRPDQVRGVRWLTLPGVGYVLVFLQQPAGLAAVVTALMGTIVLWGLFFPTEVVAGVRRRAARHRFPGRNRLGRSGVDAPRHLLIDA